MFLGLTQESGPNGSTASLTYDSYGQTQTTDALARQFGIYLRGDNSSARLTDWLKADCDRSKLRWQ